MKIGIIGMGKMGQTVSRLALARGDTVIPFSRKDRLTPIPDLFIDFSHSTAVLERLHEIIGLKRAVVIGTTGWEEEIPRAKHLVEEGGIAALYAPNFSIGVFHFTQLLRYACELLKGYDRAGMDTHHRDKKDTPSGTARQITSQLDIPFSSLRIGSSAAKLDIFFDGPHDTISLTHQAKSREGFAQGALDVADWLLSQTGWKTLDDYLHSFNHPLS